VIARATYPRSPHRHWIAAALALALLATGGTPALRRSAGGTVPPGRPRVALMPFENLSGREEQSEIFTKVFFAQLVASGAVEMVDPIQVDGAMEALRIRAAGSMTLAQIRAMADTLHVPYILLGSVLESGTIQTSDATIPAVGATLRMVDTASGRVLWAGVDFRSGEDHEKVFGWGRVRSTERLIMVLAQDMLQDFREAGARFERASQTEKKP
jgi:TolB-like protein